MRRRLVEQQQAGSCATSAASATRRRSPPDSVRDVARRRPARPNRASARARTRCRRRTPTASGRVRMAADESGLEHRGREESRRSPAARNPPLHCPRARAQRSDRHPVVRDRARGGRAQPGECAQQRRLAGAVGADDRPALAGAHVEVEAGAQRAIGDREREPAAGEARRASRSSRRPRASKKKERRHADSAVSTPTGSCSGATTRARQRVGERQQRCLRRAPLAGSSRRWSLPSTRRSACGDDAARRSRRCPRSSRRPRWRAPRAA